MSSSITLGLCLESKAELEILLEASRDCGLETVVLGSPLSEQGLRKSRAGLLDLIVADSQGLERLNFLLDAEPGGYAPLLIGLRSETAPGKGQAPSTPENAAGEGWILERPLQLGTVSDQLRRAANVQRSFAQRHEALLEELHRFRSIFDSISCGISIGDATKPHVPLVYVNPAFQRMTGYDAREVEGRSCNLLQGPETNPPEVAKIRAAIREERKEHALLRNYRKDGTLFWNELYLSPIFNLAGALTHFVGVQNDVTDRVEAQRKLAEDRDRLFAATELSMNSLYICEAVRNAQGEIEDFTFAYLNGNVADMLSIPASELIGRRMCELLPINIELGLIELYKQVVLTGESLVHEFAAEDKGIKCAWIRMHVVKYNDGVVITATDISSRKQEEERARHMADHDPLTQLPNRSVLPERIAQGQKWARRHKGAMGVLLIDLDGFKQINDTLGHATGDETLIAVAGRLINIMREVDSVIRMGGDEFVVIMPELRHSADAQICARKILEALRPPMQIAGRLVSVTCSIGIATYPDTARTVEELLSSADAAMYAAKRRGKNQAEPFHPQSDSLIIG